MRKLPLPPHPVPPLSNPPHPRHTHTHTPHEIAGEYVPGCPVNFLPIEYTDMLILVASVYFFELSCPRKRTPDDYLCDLGIVCLGVGSHRKWPPSVSVDNADRGRADILGQVEAKLCHWELSRGQQISSGCCSAWRPRKQSCGFVSVCRSSVDAR